MVLSREVRLRQTRNPRAHREHAAGQRRGSELFGGHPLPRGRDVERVQVRAAEDAASRLWYRQLDDPRDLAPGGVAHHSAGHVVYAPHVALRVDRESVGEGAARAVDGSEDAPVGEAAGVEVEVVGKDGVTE